MSDAVGVEVSAPAVLLLMVYPLIWALDLTWWRMAPDVLVIVLLLPLAWCLAANSVRRDSPVSDAPRWTYLFGGLLSCGVLLNQMTLMAIGWSWLAVRYVLPHSHLSRARLWVLCLGAFPWVLVDADRVGWFFRLSGARVTAWLFERGGFEVFAEGTQLVIDALPISIEAACGGLQVLQILMSGGVALTLMQFPQQRAFWVMLLLLPVLAWVSNTVRIVVISAWGLVYGADSAAGVFHTWGALVVFAAMLAGYLIVAEGVRRVMGGRV